jgi:nitroreductase
MIRDLILKNRTYRRFDEAVVIDRNQVAEWIDLARLSSSAANLQPMKYIIVTEKEDREKMFSNLKWAGYLQDWKGPKEGERPSAYIVMLLDYGISKNPWWDHGIAVQSIMLGAVEKGYGGCMFGALDKPAIKRDFVIGEQYEIMTVLALGKPVEEVVMEDIKDGSIKYYRDENNVHHVPKRKLEDMIIGGK